MTYEEMKAKISDKRLEELKNEAAYNMVANNSNPGVDQGGQYVYSTIYSELYHLLCSEMENIK